MKILLKQTEKKRFERLRDLTRYLNVGAVQKFPFLIIEDISKLGVVKLMTSKSFSDTEIFSYRRF